MGTLSGVFVESIKVQEPPFDEPGVIQEYVGEGITKEFLYKPATDVTDGAVEQFLTDAVDNLSSSLSQSAITYNLTIRARTERGVRAKARTYVRLVNPFSAGVIHIEGIEESDMNGQVENVQPATKLYDVSVFVAK